MTITNRSREAPWLLFILSLPTKRASQRVEVWRKLQRYGTIPLGNSGYLLPNNPVCRERFEWLATATRSYSGEASVVAVQSIDNFSHAQLREKFVAASSAQYQELLREARRQASLPTPKRSPAASTALRRKFLQIVETDFFTSPFRKRAAETLEAFEAQSAAAPAKPSDKPAHSRRYQNQLWVTRHRPGVDRVFSAWLLRRFIDRRARFTFASRESVPAKAIPFDMFQGGFGHRGEDCTFETLVKEFHIRDRKVRAMAEMVHDADLGDDKFGRKEGFGIDEVLKGWGKQQMSDHEILKRGMAMIEGLYHSFHRMAGNAIS